MFNIKANGIIINSAGRHLFRLGRTIAAICCVGIGLIMLSPAIVDAVRMTNAEKATTCQAHMNQIGKAMKSYMTDWEDTFPTNRQFQNGRVMHQTSYDVKLSEDTTLPTVFQYGVNWVEALYPYIEKVGAPGDSESVWQCPSARPSRYPSHATTAANTYAMNYNLLEQPEGILRSSGNTMLMREMDRRFGAVCRPINICNRANKRPVGAFLTDTPTKGTDPELGKEIHCRAKLHENGSNILFTDGHVKRFSTESMPTDDKLVWDKSTGQWWNAPAGGKRYIAVNP